MGSITKRLLKRFKREHRSTPAKSGKVSPEDFLFKNGHPMAILRPKDPAAKMKFWESIPPNLPEGALQAYCAEMIQSQPHRFMGYATRDGRIVNCAGFPIGRTEPGDSFVNGAGQCQPPDFMNTGKVHEEIWDGRTVMVLPNPTLSLDSNTGICMKSEDPSEKGCIFLRKGSTGEIDCHLPTLNRIMTGDPEKDYRTVCREGPEPLPPHSLSRTR